uniref:Capsid protein n=1 Tax=Cyanophage S-KM1 TaxID=187678 RepID=Q8H9Z1_9CAUD|nr:capsid protein [Cyanophage S-KM1]
MQVYFYSET